MANSRIQSAFAGATIVFIGLLVEKLFSFGTTVLVARYLSLSEFGLISLGRTLMLFVAIISVLGLDKGVSRYLPRYENPEYRKAIISSTLQITLLTSFATSFVLHLFTPIIISTLTEINQSSIVTTFIIGIPCVIAFRMFLGGIRGTEQALPRVYSRNFARPISHIFSVMLIIYFDLRIKAIAWSYPISYLVGGIVAYILLKRRIQINIIQRYKPETYKEIISFSTPLVVSGLMYRILSDIDVFLLGYLASSLSAIGIYKVIYPLSSLLLMILTAFGYMSLPILSGLESEGKMVEFKETYSLIRKWSFLLSLPASLVMVSFSDELITLTFGSKYLPGALAFQILTIGFSAHAFMGPNANALQSLGYSKLLMYDNLFAAIVNIILNIVLIPKIGIEGAAAATTMSYTLLNIICTYQLKKNANIHLSSNSEITIIALSIPLVVIIDTVFSSVINNPVRLILVASILFVTIYGVFVIRIGVRDKELDVLSGIQKSHTIPGLSMLIRWAS